ncbi:addiction module component CHP02574 family protein [Halarcobacter mediterraneus]|uniref:Addiction module component CHP02574 family protein n=1 Tax=Halarcobacter mediterraneus TaxID=2023153 RepID=A0A4Q1AW96_9BACT|nr:addiction module protein [Halarcobacter mediterraneus]RXK12272.1 addiction module component CHP02574 family protein [Halarcobacter mediterraneus]
MGIAEIKDLNTKEKLILINDIWESLEKEDFNIESPSWHNDILEERIKKIEDEKANYISIEELKNK